MFKVKDSKVLVVGGAGFVGSNLVQALLGDPSNHITVVDNLLSSTMRNVIVSPKVHCIIGSIADDEVLKSVPKDFDYIFHLSTYHGNEASIASPIEDHQHNSLTTLKLLEHFKGSTALKKMVYAGAGCTVAEKTFGKAEATLEEASVSLYLDSPYQISKMIGEYYGNYYFMRHQMPFVKARFQNVYGPREILGAGRWRHVPATVWRNVVPSFIWKALHQEVLPLHKGGVATRDFIYVEDLVQGLLACAVNGEAGEVYNLASGEETSIFDLASMINRLTSNSAGHETGQTRDWDRSGRRFGHTLKSKEKLSFQAKVPLQEGLMRTIAWTKQHMSLILSCILEHETFMPELSRYHLFQKEEVVL